MQQPDPLPETNTYQVAGMHQLAGLDRSLAIDPNMAIGHQLLGKATGLGLPGKPQPFVEALRCRPGFVLLVIVDLNLILQFSRASGTGCASAILHLRTIVAEMNFGAQSFEN